MTATIMLAKGYDPAKIKFPAMVSEKLDGVPAKIHISVTSGIYPPSTIPTERTVITAQTRQSKPFVSIRSQVAAFGDHLMRLGCLGTFVFVAEVTHKDHTMPFKDVSGHCRRQAPHDELVLNVFDFYKPTLEGPDPLPFGKRILLAQHLVRDMFWCKMIPQILVRDPVELASALSRMKMARGDFIPEGAIIRSCHDIWEEGKRGWGYQKVVDDPTMELLVHSYEEAKSKDGEPLGMVGRINCYYKDEVIGVGPGKMTHAERTSEWNFNSQRGQMWTDGVVCTVKYKRDDSYSALRQPTFQHFRPEMKGTIAYPEE